MALAVLEDLKGGELGLPPVVSRCVFQGCGAMELKCVAVRERAAPEGQGMASRSSWTQFTALMVVPLVQTNGPFG